MNINKPTNKNKILFYNIQLKSSFYFFVFNTFIYYMQNNRIKLKIEKMILMILIKKICKTFIKNKDINIFKDIFIMYVNDLDTELQIIKNKKTTKGCKKIYNYYSFINLLQTGQTWKSMNNICSYSTYYRKFQLWTINNVFMNVYKIFINFLKNQKVLTYADLKNNFIDSSNIRNKHGIDCIERNYADKGKNGTKISVITSKSGIPLSTILIPCNIHDVNTIIDTIDNSLISLENSKLGGDKGYISKNISEKLIKDYNISLITCKKKKRRTNQQILYDKKNKIKHKEEPNNKHDTKFLKNRIIVENTFSWIKNNKRIQLRYDKYYRNYISFVYLSFIKLVTNRFTPQYFINRNINYPIINQRVFRIYKNKILK